MLLKIEYCYKVYGTIRQRYGLSTEIGSRNPAGFVWEQIKSIRSLHLEGVVW